MNNSRKKRYARRLDTARSFKPSSIPRSELETVYMMLDEFEALRLCDDEELSQIDAAEEMQVSRATIQRLLLSARKKVIDVLLNNKALVIKNEILNIKLKGENKMNIEEKSVKRIAFPTGDRVTIDGHFGHTKEFAVYVVKDMELSEVIYLTPPPHTPGALPAFLGEQEVDVIITGGMGTMAVNLLKKHKVDVILGASGRIDVNLNEYLAGFLTSQGSVCAHDHKDHQHNH